MSVTEVATEVLHKAVEATTGEVRTVLGEYDCYINLCPGIPTKLIVAEDNMNS